MRRNVKRIVAAIGAAAALTATAACSGGSSGSGASGTLVAETSFDLQTIDPARQFEFTGSILDQAIYQTTLEFENGDLSKPGKGLCTFTMSKDQKVLTLTLADTNAKFSDGTPVTVDDIVFSYKRLQGIGGNPSFFLDGVDVRKVDDKTVALTSKSPNPALPYILPNASLGIVNSKVVKENGGTTDSKDGAQQFLETNSQGSGPYKVESYNADSEVVLTANDNYGGQAPKYKRVVLRNVSGETQLSDVQSGQAQVSYDLNADQIKGLDTNQVKVATQPSTRSIFIFNTTSKDVSSITSNSDFQNGVRYAVDYDKILQLAGEGAQTLASVVPNEFIGHVDKSKAIKRDLDKAKDYLKKSGYNGEPITFNYSSDQTVNGVNLATLAETLQSQLKEAGITLKLAPAPASTQLDGFRSGKQAMGLATWGADFPDPTNYLVFTPGGTIAERVKWQKGSNPQIEKLQSEAAAAEGAEQRSAKYSALFEALNKEGPFVPVVQPVTNIVVNKSITKFDSNADVSFNFATAE